MCHINIGEEFVRMLPAAGWDVAKVRKMCLTAVDGSWMAPGEQREMRHDVEQELDALDAQLTL